jgi:porphobilinogen synthase
MPGYFRHSLDLTVKEVKALWNMGIKSVLLFIKCDDELKDNKGTEAVNPNGLMQRAIKAIKDAVPEIVVMTDIALDPYSSYGHDGIVENGEIVNDITVEVLSRMSLSHAEAGADFVAPSDKMDGRILAIRTILDSAPGFGDKKTYQLDFANSDQALKETLMDVEEGADIVMVKPALYYLDVIRKIKDHVQVPVSAYHVSGEYSMIKAAAKMGWLNEEKAIIEALTSIKRAGADLIATYFAKDAVRLL